MNNSQWVFVEVYVSFFNFVNLSFAAKVTFLPIKFYEKIYFYGKFITEFCFFFFYSSHMFPWMTKFLFTENNFFPRLINRKVTDIDVVSSTVFMP